MVDETKGSAAFPFLSSRSQPGYVTQGRHATLAITSKPGLAGGALSYRLGLFAQGKGPAGGEAPDKALGEAVAVRAQAAAAVGGAAKLFPREKLKPGAAARLPYRRVPALSGSAAFVHTSIRTLRHRRPRLAGTATAARRAAVRN